MRSLIFKIARFLPLLILVAAINYMVDPSQIFANGRIEQEVADYMLAGQNIANLVNFDHRLLQRYYIQKMDPKDIFIFGSSRAMLINESFFPGESFYNASLAGTSIEDYIAIYAMLEKRNMTPSSIYIEISPWMFNVNSGQSRWKTIAKEYFEGLSILGLDIRENTFISTIDIEKYVELFSPSYLKESLKWMTRQRLFYATDDDFTGQVMKLHDGSRVYESERENLPSIELDSIIQQSLIEPYGLRDFLELDEGVMHQFEVMVAHMKARGSKVTLVLVPYHSTYFTFLQFSPQYRIIIDVENYLKDFSAESDLGLLGSYNPEMVGCLSTEFYDGLHPKRNCLDKLITRPPVDR